MTEYETVEFCDECHALQPVMFSGSGRKGMCEVGHSVLTISKVGKSFRRLENWEGVTYDQRKTI